MKTDQSIPEKRCDSVKQLKEYLPSSKLENSVFFIAIEKIPNSKIHNETPKMISCTEK